MVLKVFITTLLLLSQMANAASNPELVSIKSLHYRGSGCRPGSVVYNLSADAAAFTLIFDSYIAEGGPHTAEQDQMKACQVMIDLDYPKGWSYTVAQVDFRGYAKLDQRARAVLRTNLFFAKTMRGPALKSEFQGPYDDDYVVSDRLGIGGDHPWSGCQGRDNLTINTVAHVQAPGRSRGLLTVDSIDGEFVQTYGLRWKKCGVARRY